MQDDTQPNPPAQPTQGIAKKIAMLAVPAVVSAGVALGVLGVTGNLGGGTTTVWPGEGNALTTASAPGAAARVAEVPVSATDLSVQELVKRQSPAVVLISNETSQGGSLGSGFLIDTAGHIVTNAHVMDGATKTTVTFQDGTEKRGTVLGVDTSTDVAVLKIDQVPAGVTPVSLGNSGSLTVGQDVVAIGNPYGYSGTATTGIVSALKRTITSPSDFPIQNAIQTDAAINQGNSGGPLFDRAGRVIGINSQIASETGGNVGIGFAVPIDTVRPIVNSIIASGKAQHAWIGIQGGRAHTCPCPEVGPWHSARRAGAEPRLAGARQEGRPQGRSRCDGKRAHERRPDRRHQRHAGRRHGRRGRGSGQPQGG